MKSSTLYTNRQRGETNDRHFWLLEYRTLVDSSQADKNFLSPQPWRTRLKPAPDNTQYFGHYLFIAGPPVDDPLRVRYDLPVREILLRHRTRDTCVHLRGDSVVAMDNFGADLTVFEEYE